jgi:hypothetical protein
MIRSVSLKNPKTETNVSDQQNGARTMSPRPKPCDTPLFIRKLRTISEEEEVEDDSGEEKSAESVSDIQMGIAIGMTQVKNNVGVSAVFGPETAVTLTKYEIGAKKFGRRLSSSQRMTDKKMLYTLIMFSRDPLDVMSVTMFLIPNSAVCEYMRTALLRAHNSSTMCSPVRLCGCSEKCTHTPDKSAKIVSLYVLTNDIQIKREDQQAIHDHLYAHPELKRGLWVQYVCNTTDFTNTLISSAYFIRNIL